MNIKRTTVFLLTFLVLFVGCGNDSANTAKAAGPEWQSYDQGMKLGRSRSKHIMVNFYADWCRYCKQMFKETFADDQVRAELRKNFVSIKVDTEAQQSLAMDYSVRGLPTIWFLKSNGEKLAPVPGFVPPEQFLNILKYVSAEAYESMSFKEFMEKGGNKN